MEKNFIMTTDLDTANELRNSGLVEIEKQGDKYIFLNCIGSKINFSNNKKLVFTNKLCI